MTVCRTLFTLKTIVKASVLLISGIIIVIAGVVFFFSKGDKKVNNEPLSTKPSVQTNQEGSPSVREATRTPAVKKSYANPPAALPKAQITGKMAKIKTTYGDIIFEFFDDTPITSSNFIFLANDKFYDGLTFHRREEGFVIQGGDPNGNGTGGPGYKFVDEPVTREYDRGIVAMANAGPNTNGSQFFIMLADNPLAKQYTIFGKVTSGLDVVDKIKVGDVMESVTIE